MNFRSCSHRRVSICIAMCLTALIMLCGASDIYAKRKGYRLNTKGESTKSSVSKFEENPDTTEMEMTPGSFMVASQCKDCNNGYRLDQIVFTGFDKNQNSSKESFFIINNTDRVLTSATLYIEYLTLDGRQLHKRFVRLSCNIPPGETRKADIPTWDTQRSFYYHKSAPSKRKGNPFEVRFDPIAYYLRF